MAPTQSTIGTRLEHDDGIGRLVVLRSGEQTDGLLTEVEAVCEPGRPGVGERSFRAHDVVFEVLDGRLTLGVRGERRVLRAGQTLGLAAGTPHRIWVEPGERAARFLWRMQPAARGDDLLELVFGPTGKDELYHRTPESKREGGPHA